MKVKKSFGAIAALELAENRKVFAMAKAPALIVVKELSEARLSFCITLKGLVCRVIEGQVNSEASLELPGGRTITPPSPRTKNPYCWQKGTKPGRASRIKRHSGHNLSRASQADILCLMGGD